MFTNCEFGGQQQQQQQNQQQHGYFLRSTVRNTGSSNNQQQQQQQQQQPHRDINNNYTDQTAEHEETQKVGRSRSKLPSASSTINQPNTSANAHNNMFGHAVSGAGNHPSSNGGAVKRGYDYVDAMDDDQDYEQATLSSSSTALSNAYGNSNAGSGSRRSPAKKSKSLVTYKEMTDFFLLLESKTIMEFLKRDSCCLISDKVIKKCVFILNVLGKNK
jgi:hypothetical protein